VRIYTWRPHQDHHHQKEVDRTVDHLEVHQLGKEADHHPVEEERHIAVEEEHHTVQVAAHLAVDPSERNNISFCHLHDSYVFVTMTDIIARLSSWVYLRWIALLIRLLSRITRLLWWRPVILLVILLRWWLLIATVLSCRRLAVRRWCLRLITLLLWWVWCWLSILALYWHAGWWKHTLLLSHSEFLHDCDECCRFRKI